MADMWTIQTAMSRGELSPLLVGRVDLQSYYSGVETGLNVLSIPQGGLTKRPGTKYLGTADGDGRLETFSFNVEQNYLLAFSNLKVQIYKDGVLQTNINGSGNDYAVTPWTLAQVLEFDFIQSADTAIITHKEVETQTITRSSDTTWTVAAAPLTNVPQFDFNDASSPTPVSEIQTLDFAGQNEGDFFKITLNQIQTEEIVWSGDDGTNIANIVGALHRHPLTGSTGVSATTVVTLDKYEITFAGDSANDWDLMSVSPSGVTVSISSVAAEVQSGSTRKEDSWSATRGWPATCTFHEGRLWFGGSAQRLNTIWGSRVADFFNFDPGRSLDDDSIEATLDTDQINAIEAIFSNRSLQIFTSGGEFYVPQSPSTPTDISVTPQTNLGAKRVRPVTIDGVTLFIQRTGKAMVQFLFKDDVQANVSDSVSFLSEHLIKDPIKMSVRRGTTGRDANYVFLNNNDGTITVFNTLASEEVAGFTRWETAEDSSGDGNIRSSAVVDGLIYNLSRRTINSSTVYYVEVEDPDIQTDSAVRTTGLASNTLTGLDHLEGETVIVKADGAAQDSEVVVGGEITVDRDVTSDTIEAGLGFFPEIKDMPLNINLQNGPNASSKKKIARVSLELYESNGVIVNGQRLADRTIGQDQFDAPIPQTGIKRIHLLGWSLKAQVTITQDTPFPLTVLNIGKEVKT